MALKRSAGVGVRKAAHTKAGPELRLAEAPAGLWVGTSGWAYPTWRPGFYPAEVKPREFLRWYASQLTSVEVNYTFRKLPAAAQVREWLQETPEGFRFSFKAPQRITHFQRLVGSEDVLREFLDALRPVQRAGKLGAVLFQLPPNFKSNPERLREFLALSVWRRRGLRVAFEFRHASWFCDEVYGVLRKRGAALCVAETDDLMTPEVGTGVFRYYRLRQGGGYSAAQVAALAERLGSGLAERYVYFKHEDEPTGALNARAFLRLALAGQAKTALEVRA